MLSKFVHTANLQHVLVELKSAVPLADPAVISDIYAFEDRKLRRCPRVPGYGMSVAWGLAVAKYQYYYCHDGEISNDQSWQPKHCAFVFLRNCQYTRAPSRHVVKSTIFARDLYFLGYGGYGSRPKSPHTFWLEPLQDVTSRIDLSH